MCGNRMILFDNKTKDKAKKEKQIFELLYLVQQIREPYTNEMYEKIKVKVVPNVHY